MTSYHSASWQGLGNRCPIGAWVGRPKVHSSFGVAHHCLAASHEGSVLPAEDQIVSFISQGLQDIGLDARFNHDVAAYLIVRDREARCLHGPLDVHSIIDYVRYELGVGQGLVGATHNPKSHMQVAAFHKSRNDRVEGTLAWDESVGMGRVEHKE